MGHWILKLPSARFPLVPENEHSMMQFARFVGITTAHSGLVPIAEIEGLPESFRHERGNALWVKRFDRTPENTRVHMEDFNQLYQQFPEEKYKNYSYGNMATDLARVVGLSAVQEFSDSWDCLRTGHSPISTRAAVGNADHAPQELVPSIPRRTGRLSSRRHTILSRPSPPIEDFTMALSIAKEKDVRNFDLELLKRFLAKIPAPGTPLVETALETAGRIGRGWPAFRAGVTMPAEAQSRVTERIRSFPLTAMFAF